MQQKKMWLTAAVAGLMGAVLAGQASAETAKKAKTADNVPCYGVNKCKGAGSCKAGGSCKGQHSCGGKDGCAGKSACKGQNACKGQGWLMMPADSCTNIEGGSLKAPEKA